MARTSKSLEERIKEKNARAQKLLEEAKKVEAQRKQLEKRQQAEERKKRTHRLIQVGAAVESVLQAPIEECDIEKLILFLKRQEANGKFFTKAMQKSPETDVE